MKRGIFVLSACALLSVSAGASASCQTQNANCVGKATFSNTTTHVRCFSLFYGAGGFTNFCLNPGEVQKREVRSGDTHCVVEDNYAPPATCTHYPLIAE